MPRTPSALLQNPQFPVERGIGRINPRAQRAEPHSNECCGAGHLAWVAGAVLLLFSCSDSAGQGTSARESSSAVENAARISALIEAYEPVNPSATSDVHDRALQQQREVMEQLRGGDRSLGLAALAAFRAQAKQPDILRCALLEVAAVCAPKDCADVLEPMILTYDPALGLGVRTRAAQLLAETSPQRALALIGPIVVDENPQTTMPSKEALVRAWSAAAHRLQVEDVTVLADVAVNIAQPPEARYAAIGELGAFGGRPAALALESVLFEAASDAYLRRKAAQALAECLPAAELCPILERATAHEHDQFFLSFVADLMSKKCP